MGNVPLEKLLPRSGGSIYRLVAMASKRALELADNMPRLIDIPASTKTATIALEEIAAGKVMLREVSKDFKAPPKAAQSEEKEESVAQA